MMRTLILISLISITPRLGISQEFRQTYDSLVREFFRDVAYDFNFSSKNAFVASDLDSFTINHMIESFNEPATLHRIKFLKDSLKSETIVFTAEEKLLIKGQIEMRGKDWLKRNFENVTITTRPDTIYTKAAYELFNFTRPVFLRDNSICVFYQQNSCGALCGYGRLGLYRKLSGKWILVWTYYQWIS
jgi:hypothetical protein